MKNNKFIDIVRAENPEIEDGSLLALPDENGVFHQRRRAGFPDFYKSWEECPF